MANTHATTTHYELWYKEFGSDTWVRDPSIGAIGYDMVFKEAKAFILANYWGGTAAAVGDTFQFTGVANPTELEMPVLFRPVDAGERRVRATAFTNNFVNSFVDGNTVLMAQSFGPLVNYTGGGGLNDIFGDYARNIYAKAGYTTVMVADDRAYHNAYGSIHCATNVIRATPSSYNWWEN